MTNDAPSLILLTRPRAAAQRWAALLADRGRQSLVEPLLIIHPTARPQPDGAFQAVMLTSATVADALSQLPGAPGRAGAVAALPCFCVGEATAQAARSLGFTDIRTGTDDGLALARDIADALDPARGPILHIAGDLIEGGGPRLLQEQGFTVATWQIYEAAAASDFTPAAKQAFAAGRIAVIPVFSPRTARILVSIVEHNRLATACHAITAVAFSAAVAEALRVLPWRHLAVAARPDEAAMLTEILRDRPAPAAGTAPQGVMHRRSSARLALTTVLALGLLGGAGWLAHRHPPGLAVLHGPAPRLFQSTPPAPMPVDPVALQQRVRILEQRLDTAPETAAVPVPAPVIISAPAAPAPDPAPVKAQIDARIEELRAEMRRQMAALFAFDALREDARAGRDFTKPLVDFMAAGAGGQGTLALGLRPYAAAPPPAWAALRTNLDGRAAELAAPAAADNGAPGWRARLRAALGQLITVRAEHDPALDALNAAVAGADPAAVEAAWSGLPAATQAALRPWHDSAAARIGLDQAMAALTAALSHVDGPAPASSRVAP